MTLTTDQSSEVKQSRISKLRDKRSSLSDGEWKDILLSILLHQNTRQQETTSSEKLETVATIGGGGLTIHFRNNISGITQKLGEIHLKENEAQEIDAISWCGAAVQRSTSLEIEMEDLRVKYNEQSQTIEQLNYQLEELVSAKKKHEDTLLDKFRELLNAKKSKIRDQQRVLNGASVDPKQAAEVDKARDPSRAHAPTASRTSKRKAKGPATASESSEDDGFERKAAMQRAERDESDQANTPDATEDDATEDDEDDLGSAPRPDSIPNRTRPGENGDTQGENMQIDTLPPSRKLPFGNADMDRRHENVQEPGSADTSTLNQEAGNEDEETDDDEL